MVNSKKINKSTVAIVVLSLLLVLSLVLTATGAWFTSSTDAKAGNLDGQFGKVVVTNTGDYEGTWSNTSTGTVAGKILPGSKLTVTGGEVALSSDSVKSYVLIQIANITVKIDGQADAGFATYFTTPTFAVSGADEVDSSNCKGMYAIEKGTTLTVTGGEATISTDLPNDYQNKSISVTYTVKVVAIQFDNITPTDAYTQLTTLANSISG